jgi:hypothetical protein
MPRMRGERNLQVVTMLGEGTMLVEETMQVEETMVGR